MTALFSKFLKKLPFYFTLLLWAMNEARLILGIPSVSYCVAWMSDVICSWGWNVHIHSFICLVPWEVEVSLPLYVSLRPPHPTPHLGHLYRVSFPKRQFSILGLSKRLPTSYQLMFYSLNFQFKWEGTVYMCEYWVVRFIGNCLQNNNLLQSASWFLMSHVFPTCKRTHAPKTPESYEFMTSDLDLKHRIFSSKSDPSGDDLLRESSSNSEICKVKEKVVFSHCPTPTYGGETDRTQLITRVFIIQSGREQEAHGSPWSIAKNILLVLSKDLVLLHGTGSL